jgi:hypothetical protein
MGTGSVLVCICTDLAQFVVDEVGGFGVASDWFVMAGCVAVTAALPGLVARFVIALRASATLTLTFPFLIAVRVSCAVLRSLRPLAVRIAALLVTGLVTLTFTLLTLLTLLTLTGLLLVTGLLLLLLLLEFLAALLESLVQFDRDLDDALGVTRLVCRPKCPAKLLGIR